MIGYGSAINATDRKISSRLTAAHVLVIVLFTAGVYAVSLGNGFVIDDDIIIVRNPQTLSPQSIPEVLFSPDIIKPYYRPLNRATYIIDYQLSGLNPVWYHAVNILVHLGSALLFYFLCCRLFGEPGTALAVSLILAVHPANSEAVNFVSARNTLLAAFFSLASLLAFLRGQERGTRWPLLAAFFFFCGLLCKETAFMLIAIIGLLLVAPVLPGSGASDLPKREKIRSFTPFLAAALIYLIMRAYSLQGVIASQAAEQGLISRLTQNLTLIPQYLGLLVFPGDLTIYHVVSPEHGFFSFSAAIIAVWLVILGAVGFLLTIGNRASIFGLSWSAINYVPISNIIPIPANPIAERFLYLPAIGFFIVIGALTAQVIRRTGWKKAPVAVAAVIVVLLAVLTVRRNLEWMDEYTLYAAEVAHNPSSATARYNLGTVLRDRGDITGAVREWERAVSLDPANSDALIQLGTFNAMQGDLGKAEQFYLAALRAPRGIADPDKSMAYYNLGKIREKQGRYEEALQYYGRFLGLAPLTYEEYKADADQRSVKLRELLLRGTDNRAVTGPSGSRRKAP